MLMTTPCIRVCKLNDDKVCIGCGRTWEQIRDWIGYTDTKRKEVQESLKDFVPRIKSRFSTEN